MEPKPLTKKDLPDLASVQASMTQVIGLFGSLCWPICLGGIELYKVSDFRGMGTFSHHSKSPWKSRPSWRQRSSAALMPLLTWSARANELGCGCRRRLAPRRQELQRRLQRARRLRPWLLPWLWPLRLAYGDVRGSLSWLLDHNGPEMPPSLRTRQKWIARKMTVTNGTNNTCNTYQRNSVSVPISLPPRSTNLTWSPNTGV